MPVDYEVQGLQVTVATVFYYFSRLHRFVVLLGGFVVVDCRSFTPAERMAIDNRRRGRHLLRASWLLKVLLYALLGLIRSRMVD